MPWPAATACALAQGLACWAWRWQGLPEADAAGPGMAFGPWADALASAGNGWRADTRLISAAMRRAGASAAYQSLAGRLAIDTASVPELSRCAALRDAQTGNFTVLHLVTGCRAARVLMPWTDEPLGEPSRGAASRASVERHASFVR